MSAFRLTRLATASRRRKLLFAVVVVTLLAGSGLVVAADLVGFEAAGASKARGTPTKPGGGVPAGSDQATASAGPTSSDRPAAPSPSPAPRRSTAKPAAPAGAKPGTGNTGVPAGTALKRYPGNLDVTTNGAVIDALDVTDGINVRANNVTIKRVRARCSGGGGGGCLTIVPGHTGTLIQDVEVGGGASGTTFTGTDVGIVIGSANNAPATANHLVRVNVHHTADGLRSDGSVTITDSYVHHLDAAPGLHGDGSQSTGWSNMVFRHNTIVGGLNAAIYLNQEEPNPKITNVLIDDNWLEGASSGNTAYPLYVNDGTANVTVTNNRFNRSGYDPAFDRRGTAIVMWSNNRYEDNGALIAAPAKGA